MVRVDEIELKIDNCKREWVYRMVREMMGEWVDW